MANKLERPGRLVCAECWEENDMGREEGEPGVWDGMVKEDLDDKVTNELTWKKGRTGMNNKGRIVKVEECGKLNSDPSNVHVLTPRNWE
jgi:hypothetical protein